MLAVAASFLEVPAPSCRLEVPHVARQRSTTSAAIALATVSQSTSCRACSCPAAGPCSGNIGSAGENFSSRVAPPDAAALQSTTGRWLWLLGAAVAALRWRRHVSSPPQKRGNLALAAWQRLYRCGQLVQFSGRGQGGGGLLTPRSWHRPGRAPIKELQELADEQRMGHSV